MDGRRLSFEEEGIYNGVFVMRDRETGTLWSHYTGEAFEGPLTGKTLDWVQTRRARFADLRTTDAVVPTRRALRFRPDTVPPSGRGELLGDALPGAFKPTMPARRDRRLKRHEHGLGLFAGDAHRFYPLDRLGPAAVVNDAVGGVPVVVVVQDGTEFASAYARCLEGRSLSFTPTSFRGERAMKDDEGTIWGADGRARTGPRAGEQLQAVRSIVTDWYGWSAYFPDTTIAEPPPAE